MKHTWKYEDTYEFEASLFGLPFREAIDYVIEYNKHCGRAVIAIHYKGNKLTLTFHNDSGQIQRGFGHFDYWLHNKIGEK